MSIKESRKTSVKRDSSGSRKKEVSRRRHKSQAERMAALRTYYIDGGSLSEVAQAHDVSRVTIGNWIRTFEEKNPKISKAMRARRVKSEVSSDQLAGQEEIKSLKARILELEQELYQAELDRDVSKSMLEVFGIEEQKKALDRSSRSHEEAL